MIIFSHFLLKDDYHRRWPSHLWYLSSQIPYPTGEKNQFLRMKVKPFSEKKKVKKIRFKIIFKKKIRTFWNAFGDNIWDAFVHLNPSSDIVHLDPTSDIYIWPSCGPP